MNAEQPIAVGQIWERKRDGARVRITAYTAGWDDARYSRLDRKRNSAIYGEYLRRDYVLIEDVA